MVDLCIPGGAGFLPSTVAPEHVPSQNKSGLPTIISQGRSVKRRGV